MKIERLRIPVAASLVLANDVTEDLGSRARVDFCVCDGVSTNCSVPSCAGVEEMPGKRVDKVAKTQSNRQKLLLDQDKIDPENKRWFQLDQGDNKIEDVCEFEVIEESRFLK